MTASTQNAEKQNAAGEQVLLTDLLPPMPKHMEKHDPPYKHARHQTARDLRLMRIGAVCMTIHDRKQDHDHCPNERKRMNNRFSWKGKQQTDAKQQIDPAP